LASGLDNPELAISLQVCAAYARLRRELSCLEDPSGTQIAAKMIEVTCCLDSFIDSAIFEEVRLDDRLQIQPPHTCALDRVADAPRQSGAGLRLGQVVTSDPSLLAQFNSRVELIEHVRAVVLACDQGLFGPSRPTWVPDPLWVKLQSLYGRDDGVDG